MLGIEILQKLSSPFFDMFFKIISMTAEQYFIFTLVAAYFWCGSKKRGEYFLLTVVSGLALNNFLKDLFKIPRPFRKSPELYTPDGTKEAGKLFAIYTETATGYSFPSGHTQTSALTGSGLSIKRTRVFKIIALIYIVLVALSRMYLGVHTFWDILAGAFAGIIFAIASFYFYNYIRVRKSSIWLLCYCGPAVLALIFAHDGDGFKMSGLAIGAVLGLYFQNEYVNFEPDAAFLPGHLMKIVFGMAGSFALIELPKILLGNIAGGGVLDFIRYFLCGAFVTLGLPLFTVFFTRKRKR